MDGFTSIPIQSTDVSLNKKTAETPSGAGFATTPYTDNAIGSGDGIEILDAATQKKNVGNFDLLLPLSFLCLFGVLAYFGYLFFLRFSTLEKISILSDEFQVLAANINKKDIDNFLMLDNSLKIIKQRIGTHTQLTGVLAFVNKNIRSNVQITEYQINNNEKEVNVSLSSVAPSFKELAEQTEKMGELKIAGGIKDFRVSRMSLESDGRKVRYVLDLYFDKKKISVAALEEQSGVINQAEANE